MAIIARLGLSKEKSSLLGTHYERHRKQLDAARNDRYKTERSER